MELFHTWSFFASVRLARNCLKSSAFPTGSRNRASIAYKKPGISGEA